MARGTGRSVLAGAALLATTLGSVHAFSVFLVPLETQFGASRAAVSLTYSLALVCLTLAVLFGHRVYGVESARRIVLFVSVLAAAGAALASVAGSLPMVWLGYSGLFGAANGLGYGFGLQIAAQANPGREGVAMGVVTAAYALGSVAAPPVFSVVVETGGFGAAMWTLVLVLLIVGVAAAWLMHDARYTVQPVTSAGGAMRGLGLMWLAYFGGVMAGLMVIGHAAGIAAAAGPGLDPWLAPAVIAMCNLVGSLLGGRAADALPARAVLIVLPLMTCAGLVLLASGGAGALVAALGLAGFAYGGTIAAYPPVIAKRVGRDHSARVYGRVFTAWGVAGLTGPWLAGALYDASGQYGVALLVAACFGVVSSLAAARVFRAEAMRSA